jgi:hypothetical protein
MRNKFIIVTFISLFSFAFAATGQKLINSPYSRFNIGTLQPVGSFRSLGMGGTGTAIRDNNSIYFTNPASYSSIDTISFLFDFGVDYGRNLITDGASKYSSGDLNFHHLVIGFPLAKGWGFTAGIVPMTSGFYKVTEEVTATDPGYDPSIGTYTINHTGDGGLTKIFIGTGVKINKHFSVGANFVLVSGQLSRSNQVIFTQSSDYYSVFHDNNKEKLQLNGINFDFGIHYTTTFKNDYFLNIGASLTSGNNYKSKYNQLSMRYTAFSIGDTVSYISDNNTKTFIPGTLKVGISAGKKNKFTTAIDFTATKWSALRIPESVQYAADTKTLLVGAEYIPDKFSNYSYLSRIEYRLGGHIGNNYLIINGEQIKEYGASFGIGLPLPRTPSKANLFFDFTRKLGFSASSLHHEDYFSVGISLNMYDWWFMKRKYD